MFIARDAYLQLWYDQCGEDGLGDYYDWRRLELYGYIGC